MIDINSVGTLAIAASLWVASSPCVYAMLPEEESVEAVMARFKALELEEAENIRLVQEFEAQEKANREKFLDIDLVIVSGLYDSPCRDVPAIGEDPRTNNPRYQGRSKIYDSYYPKTSMVHSYHHEPVLSPFSALLTKACVPHHLENICFNDLPQHRQIFSFVVQGMEPMKIAGDKEVLPHYSLKPQYAMYPDSPTFSKNTLENKVLWTAVPGGEGQVMPEKDAPALLPDRVSIHPIGLPLVPMYPLVKVDEINSPEEKQRVMDIMNTRELQADAKGMVNMDDINEIPMEKRNSTIAIFKGIEADANGMVNSDEIKDVPYTLRVDPDYIILSGDCMHLKGIHPDKSADFTSLVAYEDPDKVVEITYRWLLNGTDLWIFNDRLEGVRTFRGLIDQLEGVDNFKNMLEELKRFVGLAARF